MTKTIDGMPMGNDILRGLERASELEHVQVGHDNDGQGQRGTDEPGTQPTCLKGPETKEQPDQRTVAVPAKTAGKIRR